MSTGCQTSPASKRQRLFNTEAYNAKRVSAHQHLLPDSVASAMQEHGVFTIPNEDNLDKISEQAVMLMSKDTLAYLICAVCELYHSPTVSSLIDPTPFYEEWTSILKPPPHLPDAVIKDYCVKDIAPAVADIMLQRHGVSIINDITLLRLCSECKADLVDSRPSKLPVNSIRNGNYIGHLPDIFRSLTRTDELLLALSTPVCNITTVKPTKNGEIRSHTYLVRNTAGPLTALVPRDITNLCRVTFVGTFTSRQVALTKQRYDVQLDKCRDMLGFLRKYNILYADTCPVIPDTSPDPLLLVRNSNLNESSWEWHEVVRMFPTLFPYGCGGPGENRERKLTLLQWIRRCLRVWGRQFATHYAFAAFAFDKVATQHAYRSLSCSMKVQRHAATDSQITSSVIDKALREIESYAVRSRHGLKGLTTEAADTVASIESLRRGVQAGEQTFPGSNASSSRGRREGFAAIRRLGQAHVFLTLTPNTVGSYSVGITSGLIDPTNLSALNSVLPSDDILKKAVRGNAFAAASYFVACLNVVIDVIIGFDRTYGRPKVQ
ncbi:hypothetical protein BC829DRAFT_420209, partial [Chytridium lagenaria]